MLCSVKVVGFGVDFVIYCFMKLKVINNFSVVYVWFRIDIPYVITLSCRNNFLSIFAKFLWADLNLVVNYAENTLMWPHKLAQLWKGSTVHFNKCIPFLCTKYQKHGSESNITKSEKACTQLLLAAASVFQVVLVCQAPSELSCVIFYLTPTSWCTGRPWCVQSVRAWEGSNQAYQNPFASILILKAR